MLGYLVRRKGDLMRWFSQVLVVSAGLLIALPPSFCEAQGDTPEVVVVKFIDAMRAGDWHGMAVLMHPDALAAMRELIGPLTTAPGQDELRAQLLGIASIAEAASMPDTALFARLISFTSSQDPTLAQLLRSAKLQTIGHLFEGADTVHVVYRMTMSLDGMEVSRMDVFSLRQFHDSWRGLLKGDFSAFAAAIARAVQAGS